VPVIEWRAPRLASADDPETDAHLIDSSHRGRSADLGCSREPEGPSLMRGVEGIAEEAQ